jgi:hypothetical protein
VRARAAQVPQQAGVGAAGVFKGVGQDGQAGGVEGARREGAFGVSRLGEGLHRRRSPRGGGADGAEGVAEDAAEQVALDLLSSRNGLLAGVSDCLEGGLQAVIERGLAILAGSRAAVSDSRIEFNGALGGEEGTGGSDGRGVGGGAYDLGSFSADAATAIAHNHAPTSNDDCCGR